MGDSSPTDACTPLYYEPYFIFDREDLRTLSAPGELTVVQSADGTSVGLYASESRTITDIIFWSCFVFVLCILLQSLTFFCHCCLGYFSRRTSKRRKNGRRLPFLMVFGCGILTAAVILVAFANSGVLLWLETDLNQNLTDQADGVQYYVNITTRLTNGDNDTVKEITLDPLFQAHNIRFWISLGLLGCLVVILAITFLSVCICTPFSKSSAPMVTMLVIEAFFTLLTSLVVSTLFGITLFFSIACYDLYRLGGERWCDETNNAPLERTLGNFCGQQTITKFYIVAGTYGFLIILLVVVQFFGSVYTVVVTKGYKERPPRSTRTSTAQPRQQLSHRLGPSPRDQQRHPSRHVTRSTSSSSTARRGAAAAAYQEDTFIDVNQYRLRPRGQGGSAHHGAYLNSSAATGYRDSEQDMSGQNTFNLSTITYPKEAPPSYDEVIRRDSETSSTAPLVSPGGASSRPQGLSEVPEEEEVDAEISVSAEQDSGSGIGRQDTSAIVEENV